MDQTATGGAGAAIVQNVGDNNQIIVGAQCFMHRQFHRNRRDPARPADLLLSDAQAIPLRGRGRELAALDQWLEHSDAISARCIVGGPGSGKTRLAIEACAAAEETGWFATFAPAEELRRFHAANHLANWQFDRPTLLVVDDAAQVVTVLKGWLGQLAADRGRDGAKLRILLLDRDAGPEDGWWAELRRPDSLTSARAADLFPDAPIALPPLDQMAARREIFGEAMAIAGRLCGQVTPPQPPAPDTDPAFEQRLAAIPWAGDPLWLVMAGIHAARHGAGAALALGAGDLAREMARIERERLAALAQSRGVEAEFFHHLAACVTLQQGCDLGQLPALAREEREAMGFPQAMGDEAVAELLCDALPAADGRLQPIQPDLIGEIFCLDAIMGGRTRSEEQRSAIVARCWRRSPNEVASSLIRCATDWGAGHRRHPAVRWLQETTLQGSNADELMAIAMQIPRQSRGLGGYATMLNQRILAVAASPSLQAIAHTETAQWLISDGEAGRAAAHAGAAVDLFTQLSETAPEAWRMHLAGAYDIYGRALAGGGEMAAACAAAEEAVALLRPVATSPAAVFELSRVLNHLGLHFGKIGRDKEAWQAAAESVRLRRRWMNANPEAAKPLRAMSLNNRASALANLGRLRLAIALLQRAVALRRELAATDPDQFRAVLATTLHNLSLHLAQYDRDAEAAVAAAEAVKIAREWCEAAPIREAKADLARCLTTASEIFLKRGQSDAALSNAQEGVKLYDELHNEAPKAIAVHLVRARQSLSDALWATGRAMEAIEQDRAAICALEPHFRDDSMIAEAMVEAMNTYRNRAIFLNLPFDESLTPVLESLMRMDIIKTL
jgi:tetratricopeptide (TPR) repeat protein